MPLEAAALIQGPFGRPEMLQLFRPLFREQEIVAATPPMLPEKLSGIFRVHLSPVPVLNRDFVISLTTELPIGTVLSSSILIERSFADVLNPTDSEVRAIGEANAAVGVKWLYSFLTLDKRKTYCLYEASSAEAIREAARRVGLPVDVIFELSGELRPEALGL